MSDKKQIDRLFQEKFKNFEVIPDESAWENIHNRLHKDKRKRRVLPIWWRVAGVAALLALLFTAGNAIFTDASNKITNTKVVDTKNVSEEKLNTNPEMDQHSKINTEANNNSIVTKVDNKTTNSVEKTSEAPIKSSTKVLMNQKASSTKVATNTQPKNATLNANKPINASQKDNNFGTDTKDAVVQSSSNLPEPNPNVFELQNPSKVEENAIVNTSKNAAKLAQADASLTEKLDATTDQDSITNLKEDNTIEDAIAEADKTIEEEEEEKLNRWSVSPNAAPVYFNTLGKGSSIDAQFVDNPKNGDVNMSYGINGSYAVNHKLKIRAGVNKVNLGYSTDHIISYRSAQAFTATSNTTLKNVAFNASNQNMTFLSTETLSRNNTPEIINAKSKGAIDQQFGFIEVPLEIEYAVINKKIGINVIGGFSTFFVDKNDIYSVIDGNSTRIGEANNINNMSYSANFGLGINYNFSSKLKLNLEPMFKYQINTFTNSSGDFQPYFIGLYTGFSFKF